MLGDIINKIRFHGFSYEKSELLIKYGLRSVKIRNIYLSRKVRHTQIKKTLMDPTNTCVS